MPRPSSRDRILDALEEQLIQDGHAAVTLDSVSQRAGVSKGGLFYHFASKAELYDGLLERLRDRIRDVVAGAPADPGDLVRWYLHFEDAGPGAADSRLWRTLSAGMHAADAEQTAKAGIAEVLTEWNRPLEILDAGLAEHVRLLGNGIYFDILIGDQRPPDANRSRIIEQLATLADHTR